jgi:hypothetical protein
MMKYRSEPAAAATTPGAAATAQDEVLAATRRWLEKAVIGLDLCPFAGPVYRSGRVRLAVSAQDSAAGVLDDLRAELLYLAHASPLECETTLLIHPLALTDFLAFNDFLGECESLLALLELEGELQVASFHPQYRFAGTAAADIENFTNRSPYPTLHLLREASIERAVAGPADPADIYRNNIETLRRLGHGGWRRIWNDEH